MKNTANIANIANVKSFTSSSVPSIPQIDRRSNHFTRTDVKIKFCNNIKAAVPNKILIQGKTLFPQFDFMRFGVMLKEISLSYVVLLEH